MIALALLLLTMRKNVSDRSMFVQYANDIDIKKNLSREQLARWSEIQPYEKWNLIRMSRGDESLLRNVPEISGITTPMLYIGMLFASFCWHYEDSFMPSINYHHEGAPKLWYGCAGSDASRFESAMREACPALAVDRMLVHSLVTMVPPSAFTSRGVPIYRIVQRPGQYVVTYPKAYHAGFNLGVCTHAHARSSTHG
jgi:hypothetical protein